MNPVSKNYHNITIAILILIILIQYKKSKNDPNEEFVRQQQRLTKYKENLDRQKQQYTVSDENREFFEKQQEYLNDIYRQEKQRISSSSQSKGMSRDFFRYQCKDRIRLGGGKFISDLALSPPLYRIEGSWFLCNDTGFILKQNNCNVLSFGINQDPSFDVEIDQKYKCQIESFDPFVEHPMFATIRTSKNVPENVTIRVNDRWQFHRIGLVGKSTKNEKNIGWMADLPSILQYTGLEKKVIDIFKMDIENGEWEFLEHVNHDYLCSNVKQFILETHSNFVLSSDDVNFVTAQRALELMRKLEKCFLLYHRDTRFYKSGGVGIYRNDYKTEWQEPITYEIPLKEYKNEMELIDFMVTMGELYFINKNFL